MDIAIRSSRAVINDLIALGAEFEREEDGSLAFTREGAHARARIAFHADVTGKEITEALLAAVKRLPNVLILEHVAMVDLLFDAHEAAWADADGAPSLYGCAGASRHRCILDGHDRGAARRRRCGRVPRRRPRRP
ncbi:MAG: hypothetical protein ACLTSX_10355 [Collinsella sp.]